MTALRRLAPVAALVVLWLLLQGELTAGNVVAGVVVSVAVVALVPLERPTRSHRLHPLALVALVAHFTWSVLKANAQVLATIVRPTDARLRAGIVRVDLGPTTPFVTTLVANGITLTPGSMTLTADDHGVLHVHLIGFTSVEDLRADVADLHRRVVAAFTPVPEGGHR